VDGMPPFAILFTTITSLIVLPDQRAIVIQLGRSASASPQAKRTTMKTTSLLIAGLLAFIGTSAFAQTIAIADVRADNAAIRHNTYEIKQDRRDIHHDSRVIAIEKHDIAHDLNVAALERRDAGHDQRLEDRLIAKGDIADAQKVDRARRHELNKAKIASRDAHHDRNVIAIERRDRAHDKAVLADERAERGADVIQRDRDAANIR